MFSKLFGKGNPSASPESKGSEDSRGLEVTEDDPDTAWSRWDEALAAQDSRMSEIAASEVPFPIIIGNEEGKEPDLESQTVPMTLQERSLEHRKNDALEVVETHHKRIGHTIRTLWGYKECSLYINKLILAGGDGMGHARVGFNQDAAAAMLELADVHDTLFGSFPEESGTGFGDFTVRTGWDGLR